MNLWTYLDAHPLAGAGYLVLMMTLVGRAVANGIKAWCYWRHWHYWRHWTRGRK